MSFILLLLICGLAGVDEYGDAPVPITPNCAQVVLSVEGSLTIPGKKIACRFQCHEPPPEPMRDACESLRVPSDRQNTTVCP